MVESPVLCRASVDQPECGANVLISQASKPAAGLGRKGIDVAADHFHKHQFARLGEDGLAAGSVSLTLINCKADQLRDPAIVRRSAVAME